MTYIEIYKNNKIIITKKENFIKNKNFACYVKRGINFIHLGYGNKKELILKAKKFINNLLGKKE